ncbi:MAG: hypothetical protein HC913_19765 [Microscillaceae bacterium]|nr:hypothetical protein [Microscillaceae bacterium]
MPWGLFTENEGLTNWKLHFQEKSTLSPTEKDGLEKAKMMWVKKLNFLKEREPLIIDPTQQFAISVQIAEIEEKIREIEEKLKN